MLPIKDVLAGWAIWGVPVLVALLSPWQDTITGLELISDYYQPALNRFTSAIGALGAMTAYAFLNDQSKAKQRRWAVRAGLAFFVCLVICLGLNATLGFTLFPPEGMQELIDVVHIIAYAGMFGTSGLFILCLLMAGTRRKKPPATVPPVTPAPPAS